MDESHYKSSTPRLQFGMRAMFVSVAVVALIVAAAAALHRLAVKGKGPRRPFEASLWEKAAPNSPCCRTVRSEMVDDLLAQYDFRGWSRAEIIGLLGSPSPTWAGFEQWDLYYVLGLERAGPYSLDDEALGFKFDAAGHVVKFGTSVN
jgi:hypothetical protein